MCTQLFFFLREGNMTRRWKMDAFFQLMMVLAITVSVARCGKTGGDTAGGGEDLFPQGFDPNSVSPGAGTGTGTGTNNGGSGTGGSLTEADQFALKNVFQEQTKVAPTGPSGLSQALLAEAKRLLEEEAKGRDVAVQKMALAGRMLTECAQRTAPLAPIPGQPLLGVWASADKPPCALGNVTISGNGGGQSTFAVSGQTNGTMKATDVGDGEIKAEPFAGRVTDRPESGTGTLTNPQFTKTKYGFNACSTAIVLKDSANPIPKNYTEAMKMMGGCFRQALVLMSPVFDQMFANMNPQLRQLLQQRMLGIK
jgi:hypothetical protein